MIEEILPAGTAAVEAFTDPAGVTLFPEEEAQIARAVDKRRREFTTVRDCARAALAALGLPPVPIVTGLRGSPTWPAGVVGSMTHCDGYRAAALARAGEMTTIGIDAEPNAALPAGVLDVVASPDERARIHELAASVPGVSWDRLLFSAKESVYKAWFPLTMRWLDFAGADVCVDPGTGEFSARLLVQNRTTVTGERLAGFTGRWLVRRGLIVTAIAVPRAAPEDVAAARVDAAISPAEVPPARPAPTSRPAARSH